MDDFFRFSKTFGFSAILGPPYCGIGATIRIGREMLCIPYAVFFSSFNFSPFPRAVFGAAAPFTRPRSSL